MATATAPSRADDEETTMDVYVARQPIFDLKKQVYAYELLFRDGLSNVMPAIHGDVATSHVLALSHYVIGMEKITGGKMAFINFTRNLITDEIPFMFPRETTVIEILENVKAEAAVIQACERFSRAGYLIALDDFVFDMDLVPLIRLADVIKVDFRATAPREIERYMRLLPTGKTRLLAEKVETNAEFGLALDLGFSLFQGYFFCKPEILRGREISSNRLTLLQMMSEINKPEMDLARLEKCISQDVSISYKLLRYINSAFFKRLIDISSIKQALLMLGEREVRQFVSLMALSNLSTGKPNELLKMACVRAKFFERIALINPERLKSDELFTLGLFSNIDAILDQPMEVIMARLPLSENITDALARHRGPFWDYLRLVEGFERANWDQVNHILSRLNLPKDVIPEIYQTACYWSNTLASC